MRAVTVVACALLVGAAVLVSATPLDDYVNKPDSNYAWQDTGVVVTTPLGWTGYVLNMTSQAWLTPQDWRHEHSNNGLWWHYMLVIVPDKLDPNHLDTGFLWITGGDNNPGDLPTNPYEEDPLVTASVCVANGVVGAALFQIPNQPLYFSDEYPTPRGRSEDAMVAWTWKHFLEDPSQPEWLARLPMTKASVRALDTLAAFRAPHQTITKFGIAGASKRGWTTWTTAAVDKRVIMMMPIVMDELNFVKNIHHHYRAYGGWSFALNDYYSLNFTLHLDDPQVAQMMTIIDPYVYMDRYEGIPKLVIDAGGDEFFLPDDEAWWWNDMTEPKHMLQVPNAEHSLATGLLEVIPAVVSFVGGVLANAPIPTMNWTINYDTDGSIVATVPAGQVAPINVTLWCADSVPGVNRRDFRLIGGYPKPDLQDVFWAKFPMQPIAQNTWKAAVPLPPSGWRAQMLHFKFPGVKTFGGDQFPYEFSTQISIIPNTFPYPDCSGASCKGVLL